MFYQKQFQLPHLKRGFHLITSIIESNLPELPETGLLNIFVRHTSAAITINENADPTVRLDFNSFINRIVPDGDRIFSHTLEGDDDMAAHIKSSLFGTSLNIPIIKGKLGLGTWQGIYFCEFRDVPSYRLLILTLQS